MIRSMWGGEGALRGEAMLIVGGVIPVDLQKAVRMMIS